MKYIDQVGNVFLVEKNIDINIVMFYVISVLVTALLGYMFDISILSSITVENLLLPFAGIAVTLLIIKHSLIKKIFVSYILKWKPITVKLFISEIVLFIIFAYSHNTISLVLGLLFLISGVLRIVIQATKAIFNSKMSEFMEIVRIYGYVRASVFLLTVIFTFHFLTQQLPILWTPLFIISIILNAELLANMYPYANKDASIQDSVRILRHIGQNRHVINTKELASKLSLREDVVKKRIKGLTKGNYVTVENGGIRLTRVYKDIRGGK